MLIPVSGKSLKFNQCFICFQEYLKDWYAGKDSIEKVQEYSKSQPNGEAVGGWCEVDCGNNLKIFFLVMGVLSILMSTGRVGNALVALRCIDVRDKSLSLAFNVVFLSLIGKNLLPPVTVSSDQITNPEYTNPKKTITKFVIFLIC